MKKNFTQRGSCQHKESKPFFIILVILFMTLSSSVFAGVVSGTFATLASCPMNLTCFTVDPTTGYFYGQGDQGSTNYYRYNASTNTWTTLASSPQESGNNGGATYLNGKIYNSYCSHTVITVYTIATNTWTTISDGLNSGSISTDGTDIYVSADGTFKKYVVSTGTWVTLAGTSCQPWGGLQYKNGFFYLHAGNGQNGFKKYEVATNTWTTLTNVPGGAVLGSAIYDAYYYCQGSYGGTNLYSYDLGAGEWNNTLSLPFTTNDAAIVTYGTSLYIVQGEAGTGFTKFTPNNPMLTNIEGTSLAYNLGDAAAIVSSTITASQNAGTNFQSAVVSVSANFQSGKDVLTYVDANGITGSWNSSTGELTLTGTTTIANYQTALRSVRYSNTDITSTNDTRTISYKVYDGAQYSNTAKRSIYFPGVPILTSTTVVSSITTTTASSGGFVSEDGGSSVTARGICWSTTSNPEVTDSKTENGTGLGAFTSSLTGLISGATYYVRAYATNSTGTGYGIERTFTTIGPSMVISTVSLSGFTACIGGTASTPLSFTVSGASLSANVVITAPAQYEVSTTSGSGYSGSVSLIPSGGTVASTTIYVRLLSTSDGTITGNIAITSTGATSKSVALSGTVSPLAVGGTISGSSPVTYGSSSGTMTLSGYSGIIKRWEKKLGSGSWTSIVSTATTYSETPTSTGTWYYRAVIGSGTCSDANSAEFTLTVSPKNLTVTGASVTSKTYSGTASATITGGTLTGIVGSDVVALSNNTTGTFSQTDVGTGITVTSSMTLSGANASNYTIAQPALSGSITKATLTVTALNKNRGYGAANPIFIFSYSGFVNSETSAVLDAVPTASTTADVTSNTGTYSIIPSGGSDNNYSYSYVNGILTINKISLTAIPNDQTRIYGEANPSLTVSYTGFVNSDTESGIDSKPIASTGATLTSPVGNYIVSASGGSDNNYIFSFENGTLQITKADLTVTADDQTKDYGQSNPDFTISYSGFRNSESSSVLDEVPVASSSATSVSPTGDYTIVLSDVSDNNYTVTGHNGTLTIGKAMLTVTAAAQTKIYGSLNPALTFGYSGFVNSDDATDLDVEPSASSTVDKFTSVGVYAASITLTGGSDDNYSFSYVPADFTVTKAMLNVTADIKTRIYGGANPVLTAQFSGFVNSDDETMLNLKPVFATTALATSNSGEYQIVVSGASDENYDFSYNAATLTVTKAGLEVIAEDKSKTYGEENPVLTFRYSGFVLEDDPSVIDAEPIIASNVLKSSDAGSYSIDASNASDNNYSFSYSSGTLKVNKALLTASADNKSKIYGEINPGLTISYSGFVNGDNVSNITEPSVITTALTGSSTGTYPIRLSDNTTKNYTFAFTDGVMTVNKATLSVLADNKNKKYGDVIPALTISYQGFVGADDKTALDVKPGISTVGSRYSVPGTYNISVEGGSDNNYLFNYTGATLTINKADLTFNADNKNRDYLSENPVLTYSISGFVNSENESVLDMLPSIQTIALQNSNAGSYPITLSDGIDNCYNFLYNNSVLNIVKISQTITFTDVPEKILQKDVYTLAASSTSGLEVSFESVYSEFASVSADQMTGLSRGTAKIRAYNDGNVNYFPAEIFAEVEISTTHRDILHLFTPNNDGYNDTWEIPDMASYGICDVRVFNRWGKLVYANKNYDNLWDGRSNDGDLPDGAYYFIVKTQNSGTISGTLNIVR